MLKELFLGITSFVTTYFLNPFIVAQNSCVRYGPFYLDVSQPHPYFNLTFYSVNDTVSLKRILENAMRNGFRVVLNLAGSRRYFQDSTGAFSLEKFKQRLERFAGFDFSRYDSVILCHLLFDEPHDPNNWNGTVVPYALIDSAAEYSKKLFPVLKTGVGAPCQWLGGYGSYQYLDYCKPQYAYPKGPIQDFILENDQAALASGLKIFYSINVLSGWKQQQPFPADTLLRVSLALLKDTLSDGLLYWKYDSTYFTNPEVEDKLGRIPDSLCDAVLSAVQPTSENGLIYPNPFLHGVYFSPLHQTNGNIIVTIQDIHGKEIRRFNLHESHEPLYLDLRFLTPGVYVLCTTDGSIHGCEKLFKY